MNQQEIPSEYRAVTTASISFTKLPSLLDNLEVSDSDFLIVCQILITKHNHLIELESGKVKRIEKIGFENTTKVVVHHEFNPLRCYIVCLTKGNVVHLLAYESLEVINNWKEIQDVSVDDPYETGKPHLQLLSTLGNYLPLDAKDFLIGDQQTCDQSKVKAEATAALANRLKMSLWHSQSLQLEHQRKELFIMRKLSDISYQLKTKNFLQSNEVSGSSMCHKTVRECLSQNNSKLSSILTEESFLKVLTTRHRLVHGKWVICVSVVNSSDKYLIREPQLTLHCSNTINRLSYETKFVKTVQRKINYQEFNSDIFIEEIEPPILRPSKRAYLIAICRMPDFSSDSMISCDGLVSFKVRSLRPSEVRDDHFMRQISFPSVYLDATATKTSCVDLSRHSATVGFSFDVLTLLVSSVKRTLILETILTPLIQVMTAFLRHDCIVKMRCLNTFYYFNSPVIDSLHYAIFSCKQISAHKLSLTTYTKDDDQCFILLHTLKKMFPKDVLVKCAELENPANFEHMHDNLISKMYDCISVISNKGQIEAIGQESKIKKIKSSDECSSEAYKEGRKNIEEIHKDIVLKESEYVQWRELLHDLHVKMEQLYYNAID